jgi:hypothetical protein
VSDTEPTRKVFSVDVGDMKPDEAAAIVDTIKRGINKQVLFENPEDAIKNLKRSFELEDDDAVVIERLQAAPESHVFNISLPRTFYPPENPLKLTPEEIAENERLWAEENPSKATATSPEAAVDDCIHKLDQAKAHWADAAKALELELGGCMGGKKDCNGGSDTCTCGNDAGC